MTVFELRELARIIGQAAAAMDGQDAEALITGMWRFLRQKNPDLTLQAWQDQVSMTRERAARLRSGRRAGQSFPGGPLDPPGADASPAARPVGGVRTPRKPRKAP